MYEYEYDDDVTAHWLLMAVVQQPFETNLNQFCKLEPLAYLNGAAAHRGDFPNDGEIWWMLTNLTSPLAQPGALLIGRLENAREYREHELTSSKYQAIRESVRLLDSSIAREILDIPGDEISRLQDIVDGEFGLALSHRPTPQVLLRWRGDVYGPFTATAALAPAHPHGDHPYTVSFVPSDFEMGVFRIPNDQLQTVAGEYLFETEAVVSTTPMRRSESTRLTDVRYVVLFSPGYDLLLAQNPTRLVLESLRQKLTRFAKDCLTRRQRRDLRHLLDELELKGREAEQAEDLLNTVRSVKHTIERQDSTLDAVARVLLESGMLGEERIRQAEEVYAQRYIQDRGAALQAEIDRLVVDRRAEVERTEAELRTVQGQLTNIQARFQQEEKARRAELETALLSERQQAEAEIVAERERLEGALAELHQQREVLQGSLEKATADLRYASDDVVNRILTIAPLLHRMGLIGAPAPVPTSPAPSEPVATAAPPRSGADGRAPTDRHVVSPFELPAFVRADGALVDPPIPESAFFERFKNLVEASGFQYRELDLIRFHLSVKVGVLTVLAGPSGTGKSSLPMLYGRALAGDEIEHGRPDCLMVTVNPSWMDVRDLLGHLNTLEGRFFPAESGLYQHLIFAQEEHRSRSAATGIYLTCLDEMNLSQVEHYCSDLMTVLEREGDQRTIQCFSAEAAGEDCSFRPWSTIKLSPALRFAGTVNFDETTRALSDRFLDRTNLIRLSPGPLPATSRSNTDTLARASGRMVTLTDFETWRGSDVLPPDLARHLDTMRPLFQQLGCPISPRVYRAICRFVGSCSPLMEPEKAFDVQLAQRVLPKLRRLITRRQLEALDELRRLLEGDKVSPFNETLLLLDDVQQSSASASAGRDWLVQD